MNKGLGNAIVVVMLLLMFMTYILYVLNPDPAGAPTMSLIINGSLGAIIILTIALIGIVMRDADFGTP